MDTSTFSRAQSVGAFFFIPSVLASAPPRLLLGLLVCASRRCVFSGLECAWHRARRSSDTGDLDYGLSLPRLVPHSGYYYVAGCVNGPCV
jgi:hypothetical protein